MKRTAIVFIALLLTAYVLACPSAADETAADRTVEDMAADVIGLFPRAEGHVSGVDGETVVLDIGSDDGLKPGMEVFLYREGKPILHPVTKAVLGKMEERLGRVELTEVSGGSSSGRLTELLVTLIVPGDTARLSTEPSRLLLVTLGPDYDPAILDRLARELGDSGRFEMLDLQERPEAGRLSPDEAASIASGAGADCVLGFSMAATSEKSRVTVGVELFAADGSAMLLLSDTVDATPEVYEESVMDIALVRGDFRDFYITQDLKFRGKHMVTGNLSGDASPEVVVSDGRGLVVYRFDERIMRELWREEGEVSNKILSLDCADLNGNGLDELYVTNFVDDAVSSYVVEYTDGGFRRVAGPMAVFFRVLEVPGRGSMLITTTKGSDAPYSGIINEYAWRDGSLVKGDSVELPDRIKDPYGFALVDLIPDAEGAKKPEGDKGPFDGLEVVWVDDSDYIQVLGMDGERLWKSPDHYGGYDNYFELDKRSLALANYDPRGKVKGRLIVRDDPAGQKMVVVTRNVPMTYATEKFKGYSTSDIFALYWDGAKMETAWSIRNIDGYIADISMAEIIKPGREEILVLVEPTMKLLKKSKSLPVGSVSSFSNITAEKSSLYVYKVPLR